MTVELPRLAYAHEWMTDWGGSEDVVRAMIETRPGIALHATIDFLSEPDRAKLRGIPIRTTFLQRMPYVRSRFWHYLPITALAVETHDLRDADVIVSSSHAFAKGVLTTGEQLHVSYVHSPMRYAWDLHHEYLKDYHLERGLKGSMARYMFHRLRIWDRQTANNVDLFLANSDYVRRRIWRAYRRPARVLYPPVSVDRFSFEAKKEDFYVTVSRLVSYKRIDLMLDAFRAMPAKKLIVIGDGPEAASLRSRCPANVTMLGWQPHEVVLRHLQSARAFVFAAREDFGISPVEAQSCGTPVIAFGAGGSLETVRGQAQGLPTGLHFAQQTAASLAQAIEEFDAARHTIDPHVCREWAETFSEARFRREYSDCIDQAWALWQRNPQSMERELITRPEPALCPEPKGCQ